MDKLVYVLQCTSSSKHFEILRKATKGKVTKEVTLDYQAQHWSLLIPKSKIFTVSDSHWTVVGNNATYDVHCSEGCQGSCQQICRICNVCVHMYTCSCPCKYMCKHIQACLSSSTGSTHRIPAPTHSREFFSSNDDYSVLPDPDPQSAYDATASTSCNISDQHSLRRMQIMRELKEAAKAFTHAAKAFSSQSSTLQKEDVLQNLRQAKAFTRSLCSDHSQNRLAMHPENDYVPPNKHLLPQWFTFSTGIVSKRKARPAGERSRRSKWIKFTLSSAGNTDDQSRIALADKVEAAQGHPAAQDNPLSTMQQQGPVRKIPRSILKSCLSIQR